MADRYPSGRGICDAYNVLTSTTASLFFLQPAWLASEVARATHRARSRLGSYCCALALDTLGYVSRHGHRAQNLTIAVLYDCERHFDI